MSTSLWYLEPYCSDEQNIYIFFYAYSCLSFPLNFTQLLPIATHSQIPSTLHTNTHSLALHIKHNQNPSSTFPLILLKKMTTNNTIVTNPVIHNTNESNNTLIAINISAQAPLKLTTSNYISWKLQFHTLFVGYDILRYVDGSKPCPSTTFNQNNTIIPSPAHIIWIRQDQLILNALVGSFFPTIIPFIAQAKTSQEAWTILANTYTKPS